uniref:Uncharacterized protein n=1 Tax=Chrysolophus pictus TaxID=9089 RepID=A0A8C3KS56_CHRPC
MSGRRRECLCPRASLLQHHPRPGQVQAARRRQGKAAVRRARRRLTAQARITARSSPCSAELPGSGSNGTAGPFCAAAAASRGLNKLVRSQNVSSLDGRRDSSRLYYFLATLGSLRAVSTTIPCPAPISSKARVDRRRRRPPSPGGCFRLRTAAAPLRSGPSALRSSAPCSGGEKARNSRRGLQLPAGSSALRPAPHHGRAGAARTAPRTELLPTSPSRPAFALHIHEAAAPDWRNRAPAASRWPARPPLTQPRLPSPGRDSPGRGTGPAAQPAPSPRSRQRRSPGAALIVPPAPGTMDELDQSPLVSSSSSGPPRPQQPQFNYQFVLDDEKEEDEEEEEEEEEDEDFDEQLEVMERKPVAAPQERPSPPQD